MCGIFGITNHPEASKLTYLGLYALQHRGQEGAGIVSSAGDSLCSYRQEGLVADIFSEATLAKLRGKSAIGHVRYSTTGETILLNVQPLKFDFSQGEVAIAHNGNLLNSEKLKKDFEEQGSIFQTTSDTEVFVHLIAKSEEKFLEDKIVDSLKRVRGSYALLILTPKKLFAIRDPWGIRPLSLGRLKDSWVVSSESCAFDLIEARFEREIEPGEMVVIDEDNQLSSIKPFEKIENRLCVFEYVYFARPDSFLLGKSTYEIRKRFGKRLAKERPAQADLVVPVPDSGVGAALGFSEESGIKFDFGIIRNHYIGRTFIEPEQSIRNFGARLKLNPLKDFLEGKRVVVVDDSLVRGTTSKKIVSLLREAGVSSVHLRISSPPIKFPCYYGIDTPTRQELIASSSSIEETRAFIKADSLGYLSLEGMMAEVADLKSDFCQACFSGNYPVS